MQAGLSEAEAENKARLFECGRSATERHRRHGTLRWFVPGRIEVLGKHTDYAGGRSLLCTAERGFCVGAIPRADSLVRIHDVVRRQSFDFTISPELAVPGFLAGGSMPQLWRVAWPAIFPEPSSAPTSPWPAIFPLPPA